MLWRNASDGEALRAGFQQPAIRARTRRRRRKRRTLYDHGTHYDYDIHGNVKTLIQDNQLMASLDANIADQRFKRMDYNYDLVSGNVHRVDYETGNADQWHHAYTYDADNRITQAFTTTTTPLMESDLGQTALQNEAGMTPYWDKEAAYRYYKHGPLARTELGQQQVQGLDYVYTVQGWLKGVNSNTLQADRDPGQDNGIGSGNAIVAGDVYGYSLHYFDGDYASIGGSTGAFADQSAGTIASASYSKDLYNGNIARMITTITNPDTREVLPMGNAYQYDQLNRLKGSRGFFGLDAETNSWQSETATARYLNAFTYDANGNILGQLRYDGTGVPIDSLTYRYHTSGTGSRISNRLYHVNDSVGSGDHADDIDDMGTFDNTSAVNGNNNYVYDKEGRLIHDEQEGIDQISWRVDGKVKVIVRELGSEKKSLVFEYDAMGHRVAKHVVNSSTYELEHSTYYVLDAQGNVMSVYERDVNEAQESVAFAQTEKHIYGSSRLGILKDSIPLLGTENDTINAMLTNHVIGKRSYELSNHLGNVLSTISDVITTTVIDDTLIAPTITGHGISVSGDMVTRTLTPDNLWNAGGVSAQTVNEGDTLIWTLGGPSYLDNRFVMCGLSYDSPDDDYASIDYCWYTYGTAGLYIYEGGGSPGEFGGFDTGHILKIARVGGNIEYYHNGALIRTTTDAHPDQPMVIDFSMYEATRYIYQLRIAKKAVVYSAQIRSSQDYSPFGVTLEGRSFVKTGAEKDRYGYQGSEMDNEVKGNGNSYTTEFRQLDPRLGRWLSIDPKATVTPWESPYASMGNNPIYHNDVLGDVVEPAPGEKSGVNNAKAWNKYIRRKEGEKTLQVLAPDGKYHTFNKSNFSFSFSDGKESEGQIKKEGVWQIKNDAGHYMWDNTVGKYVLNESGIEPAQNGPPGMSGTTTYAGGNNPIDYSQPPQNIADYGGYVHDKDYDKLRLKGTLGTLDPRSMDANYKLTSECGVIMIMYERGAIDPYTGAPVSPLTYRLAKKMTQFDILEAIKSPITLPQQPRKALEGANEVLSKVPSFYPSIGW